MAQHLGCYLLAGFRQPSSSNTLVRVWLFWGTMLLSGDLGGSQTNEPSTFANLSLEQLSAIEVTTLSRRPTTLAESPSAVTVLSGEEILRSGAKSLPEALRLVPGLMVGQIDANNWAISSRGFNSQYASKMLVMIDGRSVYSPLLSLTYWDTQKVMLEDLEKIEVVRGPGSTLWGANAVNGVINIVTKDARDTQGGLVYAGGGWPQEVLSGSRYGGQMGSNTYYRVYGLYEQSAAFPLEATGESGPDFWRMGQGGFRIDHETAGGAHLTWQGDGYGQETPDAGQSAEGVNTLARYDQNLSEASHIQMQVYYDYTRRENFLFELPRHTVDVDLQQDVALGRRQNLVWGIGYRMNHTDYISTAPEFRILQDELTTQLFSGFVEDEIQIVQDKVTLTAGCKLEHNEITGWEPQPEVRLAVRPTERHLFWTSVSRAVCMPSDAAGYKTLSYPLGTAGGVRGWYLANPDIESEELIAYELGHRFQILTNLSSDIAVYYNDYDKLITQVPRADAVSPGTTYISPENLLSGGVYGGEISLTYRVKEWWRLTAWYALCLADLDGPPEAQADVRRTESRIPNHQAHLRSSFDLSKHWKLDVQLRYVDAVESIPSYIEGDLRLAFQPCERLEIAVVGQNLIHDTHQEFLQAAVPYHAEVPRGVYATLRWRF